MTRGRQMEEKKHPTKKVVAKKNSLGTSNTNDGRAFKPKGKKNKIQYQNKISDSGLQGHVNRLLIATPTLGNVRIEWVNARYGQIIPTNWSMVQMQQFMNSFVAMRYQVADAQNIIVREAIAQDFEWLILLEDDTCPPPDALVRFNEYILSAEVPVVSGLYYTKSEPSEPLLYRGRGTSFYDNWKMGDKVWVDGVPTGCLLIRVDLLREMWKDSPEYLTPGSGQRVRRVFDTPNKMWFDEKQGQFATVTGTSDLDWCSRVIEGKYLERAGYPELQKEEFPFLVDTNIFCKHVDIRGRVFPY